MKFALLILSAISGSRSGANFARSVVIASVNNWMREEVRKIVVLADLLVIVLPRRPIITRMAGAVKFRPVSFTLRFQASCLPTA